MPCIGMDRPRSRISCYLRLHSVPRPHTGMTHAEFIEANTDLTYEQFTRIINFVLLHKKFERSYASHHEVPRALMEGIHERDPRVFSMLTHELGYYLGQELYDGYHSGRVRREEIADLFARRFDGRSEPIEAYLSLVERLATQARRGRR